MSQPYWREAIQVALDECGAPPLTDAQLDAVARDLDGAAENQGQWDGRECIPNPLVTEIEEIKRKAKAAAERAERDQENILNAFAFTHGLRLGSVCFDGEQVFVRGSR